MKNTFEKAIQYAWVTLCALIFLFLFVDRCHGQDYHRVYVDTVWQGAYSPGVIFSYRGPAPLPGPTKYSPTDSLWEELTEWGFRPAKTFPRPDTLDATPINFEDSGTTYLVQYDEISLTLYARRAYISGETTWLSPCKRISMGDKGTTLQVIDIIQDYYYLGRMTFDQFCLDQKVSPTPVAKQYWQTCVEFHNFFKNIEK